MSIKLSAHKLMRAAAPFMQKQNPFGFNDHRPFSGFSDELAYGVAPNGKIVHISNTIRGLSCNCTCPVCDLALVAKKGSKQLHHFAHYKKAVTCGQVAETNAHIWAKEVLEREKQLTIPAIVAEHAGYAEIVSPVRVYKFAHAILEKRLDSIVPDVLLITANGARLIVEVRVTHACDEAKLEKLRKEGLSAIEIDLRHYRTATDQAAVESALLSGAPREWLSNAKQSVFEERLRERLTAEAVRKTKEAEDQAKRIAAAEVNQKRREQQEEQNKVNLLIEAVRTHMTISSVLPPDINALFEAFDDVPWSHQQTIGFLVHPHVWQTELVRKFLTYPDALEYHWADHISTGLAMRMISRHLIKAFRNVISAQVRAKLHEKWPQYRVPTEAVEEFLDGLAGAGYLWAPQSGQYEITEEYADRLTKRERLRQEHKRRTDDLRRRITIVIARLPPDERGSFDLNRWFETQVASFSANPDMLCQRGDESYREFERALKHVELMIDGGPVIEELLGLPLGGEVARAEIRKRDRLLHAASQRRSNLADAARSALGDSADAWLYDPSEGDPKLTRIDNAGMDDMSYQRARRALSAAVVVQQETIRAAKERSSRHKELREAAARVFDKDHLELFLRAFHPRFGRSPLDHCADYRTLQECLAILPRARRGRSR